MKLMSSKRKVIIILKEESIGIPGIYRQGGRTFYKATQKDLTRISNKINKVYLEDSKTSWKRPLPTQLNLFEKEDKNKKPF